MPEAGWGAGTRARQRKHVSAGAFYARVGIIAVSAHPLGEPFAAMLVTATPGAR
jgi:hypothetical protein